MGIADRIKGFMECEGRSCSMDFGCVTSLYVYRIGKEEFSITGIEYGLMVLLNNFFVKGL